MITRVFSQFQISDEKYRIIETHDSTVVQILKPVSMDIPEEWIPLFSSLRSAQGLKACINFLGLYVLNKQSDANYLWDRMV